MKVLFISEYFPPLVKGGGEISCFLLAKYLSKEGIKVHVLTSKFKKIKKYEIIDGINIHRELTTGEDPTSISSNIKRSISFSKSVNKKTKEILKKHKFDIIHYFNITSIDGIIETNTPKVMHINSPILFSPEATKKEDVLKNYKTFNKFILRSKKLGKAKNYWFLKHNPIFKRTLYQKFKKRLSKLNKVDFFTPISNNLKNILGKNNIPKNNIKVIHNIVETDKFIENKTDNKKLKIIYLGDYIDFKGVFDLLFSLKNLKRGYECDFYGSGTEKEKIIQFIKKNKLNVKVHERLNYKEIPIILANHNVLVFPSRIEEAFGRVLVESMAAGCTPISSKIGGTTDIIKNGKNGYFFESGNYKQLEELLNTLDLNNINRKKLIKESKKYDGKILAKKLVKIYKSLIK